MNQRERVIKAIRHESTDILPWQLDLTAGVHETLSKHYADSDFLHKYIGNHLVKEQTTNHQFIDPMTYKDIFGVIWSLEQKGGDAGVITDYILKEPEIASYSFPEPDVELIKKKCEQLVKNYNHHFKIFEITLSLFERAWTLRGMENLMMDFLLNENFADELLDRILEFNLKVIDIAAQYPIDCIMFGDDWGQQKGLLFGLKLWRRYIKPRISAMYERVKKHGLYIIQHSCGDNNELIKDLIDMGLDVYNTFQPEIYNIEKFKNEFGKYITIYGGISSQGILSRGMPMEVKNETKRIMGILGRNGGYIVAPTHQITTDIPLENIMAFVEAVKEQ